MIQQTPFLPSAVSRRTKADQDVVRSELQDGVREGCPGKFVSAHAGCGDTFGLELAKDGLKAVIGYVTCP